MRRRQFANVMRRALDFIDPPYDQTIRVVSSTGTVLDGTNSAVTANYDRTVRIVGSTGLVIDSFGGGGGGGPVTSATVTLTSAQIKALDLTPVTLVAAPGAGKVVQVLSISMEYVFGTVAYTNAGAGDSFLITYGGIASSQTTDIFSGSAPVNLISATTQSAWWPVSMGGVAAGGIYPTTVRPYPLATVSNKAVTLQNNSGAAYITGDGTLNVYVNYVVVTL